MRIIHRLRDICKEYRVKVQLCSEQYRKIKITKECKFHAKSISRIVQWHCSDVEEGDLKKDLAEIGYKIYYAGPNETDPKYIYTNKDPRGWIEMPEKAEGPKKDAPAFKKPAFEKLEDSEFAFSKDDTRIETGEEIGSPAGDKIAIAKIRIKEQIGALTEELREIEVAEKILNKYKGG